MLSVWLTRTFLNLPKLIVIDCSTSDGSDKILINRTLFLSKGVIFRIFAERTCRPQAWFSHLLSLGLYSASMGSKVTSYSSIVNFAN